jgi:peptide/nickel transport system permease protein
MKIEVLFYIAKRVLLMIPTLFIISIISFMVIELPPGDFTEYLLKAYNINNRVEEAQIRAELQEEYGLGESVVVRYYKWMNNFFHLDLGRSYVYSESVSKLILSKIGLTVIISVFTILFTWIVSIPISIYSAVKQYSMGDYVFTFVGFIGLAIPNFFLALILMYFGYTVFDIPIGGLFSREFSMAAWSFAKFIDMLKHLWVPVIVIGTAGTAQMIRLLRSMILDELKKDYVRTARAKGLSELKILFRHPLRVALLPIISTIGWMLPAVISGDAITSQVLDLPTTGPLLLQALAQQDTYLAGSFLFMVSILTVIGTLISDIALVWVDPRISLTESKSV